MCMENKKICFSYSRISTNTQKDGTGLKRQLDASKRVAEAQGWQFREHFEDIGISGYTGANLDESAQLGRFINMLKTQPIIQPENIVLIIENFDRLSRLPAMRVVSLLSDILATGCSIYTTSDSQLFTKDNMDDDISKLMICVVNMHRAHNESQMRSQRITAAWQSKINKMNCQPQTGNHPSWVNLIDGEFLIKPGAKKTIAYIYQLSITEDLGYIAITTELNNNIKKYPTFNTSEKWTAIYVRRILNSDAVFGRFTPRKSKPIDNYFPVVIQHNIFLLSKSKTKNRNRRGGTRSPTTYTNLFSKSKCAECGGTMRCIGNGHGNYLRCINSVSNMSTIDCHSGGWLLKDFEKAFFDKVKEIDFTHTLMNPSLTSQQDCDSMHELILANDAKYDAIMQLMIDASISNNQQRTDAYNKQLTECEHEKNRLSKIYDDMQLTLINEKIVIPYDELKTIYSETEMADVNVRRRIASLIRDACTITVYNPKHNVPEYEIMDLVDGRVITKLIETHGSVSKAEVWLKRNRNGQIWLTHHLREIRIHFKNNIGTRICRPGMFDGRSYLLKRRPR